MPPGTSDRPGLDWQAAAGHGTSHFLQPLRQRRKIGVWIDVQIHREFALRVADAEQTLHHIIAISARIREAGTDAIEHVADTVQRTFDGIGGIGDEICAEFYRPQCGASECISEGLGLRHFFERGDRVKFVQAQFRKLDTIERKLPIRRIDVEDAHHAIAAYEWLDRVVRSLAALPRNFSTGSGFGNSRAVAGGVITPRAAVTSSARARLLRRSCRLATGLAAGVMELPHCMH